jgi:hypothetical protein
MLQLFLLCPHIPSAPRLQTLPSLKMRDNISNPRKTAEVALSYDPEGRGKLM